MELLQRIEDRGYPTDYLLARIHGRRRFLFDDWDKVLSIPDISDYLMTTQYGPFIAEQSSEGIRACFLRESRWIYHQMNAGVRKVFQYYFMYSELNTLLTCLRYKSGTGDNTQVERLLEFSLLARKLKAILSIDNDISSVIYLLDKKSNLIPSGPGSLGSLFSNNGLEAVEQRITTALFDHITGSEIHPVMKFFFTSVIDAKNLTTLHRHLKWGTVSKQGFISGGTISAGRLLKLSRSRSSEEILRLIGRHTGLVIDEPDTARIESSLQRKLTKEIKKLDREGSHIAMILNYLWRCFLEAKNLSIIAYGRKIDTALIREELVH